MSSTNATMQQYSSNSTYAQTQTTSLCHPTPHTTYNTLPIERPSNKSQIKHPIDTYACRSPSQPTNCTLPHALVLWIQYLRDKISVSLWCQHRFRALPHCNTISNTTPPEIRTPAACPPYLFSTTHRHQGAQYGTEQHETCAAQHVFALYLNLRRHMANHSACHIRKCAVVSRERALPMFMVVGLLGVCVSCFHEMRARFVADDCMHFISQQAPSGEYSRCSHYPMLY